MQADVRNEYENYDEHNAMARGCGGEQQRFFPGNPYYIRLACSGNSAVQELCSPLTTVPGCPAAPQPESIKHCLLCCLRSRSSQVILQLISFICMTLAFLFFFFFFFLLQSVCLFSAAHNVNFSTPPEVQMYVEAIFQKFEWKLSRK